MAASTRMFVCVCSPLLREWVGEGSDSSKSHDGGVCERTHTQRVVKPTTLLTTVTMHIASRCVWLADTSTSNLLAQSEVIR